jgi:hypothetical protein
VDLSRFADPLLRNTDMDLAAPVFYELSSPFLCCREDHKVSLLDLFCLIVLLMKYVPKFTFLTVCYLLLFLKHAEV